MIDIFYTVLINSKKPGHMIFMRRKCKRSQALRHTCNLYPKCACTGWLKSMVKNTIQIQQSMILCWKY